MKAVIRRRASVTELSLALRAAFGEVADVDCLTFPDSGRFRGIALVRFADDAGAQKSETLRLMMLSLR